MGKKITGLIFLLIICLSDSYAQKALTLRECYDMASRASALAGEKEALSDMSGIRMSNLSKNWLPDLNAGASLTYNSDVVNLKGVFESSPIPGLVDMINPLPHEQYRLTIDINQVIWDGGATKGSKAIEMAGLNVSLKQTDSDLYKLKERVNSCFFSLLLLSGQKGLLLNYLEILEMKLNSMQAALRNGLILSSDIDVLMSEKLRITQQLSENEIQYQALIQVLSGITGSAIDPSAELILPDMPEALPGELMRPELQLFDLRIDQLNAGLSLIGSTRMPKAFGFATVGYGMPPGNNFFEDTFQPYYVVGAGIKWKITDWNRAKNEKQMVSFQQAILQNRKKDLEDNIFRQMDMKRAEIRSLTSLLVSDTGLIALRKKITAAAESKYENGTITATELLGEMNSERQALVNHEIHKISLALAKAEYMNLSGTEIE